MQPLQPNSSHKVCVIIAAYNAAGTIARAVKSALAEPEVAEVVVVDDVSTDDTVAVARALDDGQGRLKVLVQEKNAGPSAARNRAIRESVSPWLCVLDADDFFLPGRMKNLLTYARQADMIGDDMRQVPETDVEAQGKSLFAGTVSSPKTISFTEFVLSNVTKKGQYRSELGFLKPLMRRKFLMDNAIWYQEHMRLGEDFELYARALALGARLMIIPQQGYVSVVRANSLSGRHSEEDLLHFRDCDVKLEHEIALSQEGKEALRQHYLSVDCRLQWRLLINAVKASDTKAAMATFLRPWPVPFYLWLQLGKEFYLRAGRRIGLMV